MITHTFADAQWRRLRANLPKNAGLRRRAEIVSSSKPLTPEDGQAMESPARALRAVPPLGEEAELATIFVDGCIVCAHPRRPIHIALTAGQRHELSLADELLATSRGKARIGHTDDSNGGRQGRSRAENAGGP